MPWVRRGDGREKSVEFEQGRSVLVLILIPNDRGRAHGGESQRWHCPLRGESPHRRLHGLARTTSSPNRLAKIECRVVWIGDFEILYFVKVFGVSIGDIFPRESAKTPCSGHDRAAQRKPGKPFRISLK